VCVDVLKQLHKSPGAPSSAVRFLAPVQFGTVNGTSDCMVAVLSGAGTAASSRLITDQSSRGCTTVFYTARLLLLLLLLKKKGKVILVTGLRGL
jgi:hypothetical protein